MIEKNADGCVSVTKLPTLYIFSRTNTSNAKHGVIAKNWAAKALRRRCKRKPMAVRIKKPSIITNASLVVDECCLYGHSMCDQQMPEYCWVNKANPKDCLCRMGNPTNPYGGDQYEKWVAPKPTAPPTYRQM